MSLSHLVVLGTAASVPTARRANVGFALRLPSGELHLVECGPGIYQRLLRAGLDPLAVTDVYLTHQHGDHSLGVPMFDNGRWYRGSNRVVRLHGPEEALAAVRAVTLAVYPDHLRRWESSVELHPHPTDGSSVEAPAPDLRVASAPAAHSVAGVAYRFDLPSGASFVYSGDTPPSDVVAGLAAGADLLLHDATFSASLAPGRVGADHATPTDAALVAARAGVRRLGLVHLAPELDGHEEEIVREARRSFAGEVFVPADGQVLEL